MPDVPTRRSLATRSRREILEVRQLHTPTEAYAEVPKGYVSSGLHRRETLRTHDCAHLCAASACAICGGRDLAWMRAMPLALSMRLNTAASSGHAAGWLLLLRTDASCAAADPRSGRLSGRWPD